MADLYSVIPGIQVSDNEVLEAELIAVQVLQAKYPDLDLREGTGIRDLVVRPAATLMAMLNKSLTFYFAQNTIDGITDDTAQDILDKIMSNWFITRKQGSKAIINARLFFARQKDVALTTDTFFSTDSILKFFPSSNVSIPSAQLTFDTFNNEYYYDVDLTAEAEGTTYNISSGSLLYFTNFDPFFLRAEINFLKASAVETETNSEFITRANTAISTRNLINNRSITSNMLEDFTALDGVTAIGMGDAEMIRDQVWSYVSTLTPPTALIHTGGKVDVYCRVPLASSVVQVTTDSSGIAQLGGAIYEFARSQIPGSAVADQIPFYDTKTVTSLTSASTTATATVTSHGYTTGDSITIIGATPAGYNGTFTVTNTGTNTFTYPVVAGLATPATGTITSNKPVAYTAANFYSQTQTLTSLTQSAGVATATLNSHGVSTGRWVLISGATPSGYNGWKLVTNATQNTFTFVVSNGLSSPATGTIGVTATKPESDFGFSNKSIQTVNFGVPQANKTASFTVKTFSNIDGLQTYLNDEDRRVLCADMLARGYNLYLLTVNIVAYNGPAPDSTSCTDIVTSYLSSLAPGELFIMADLTAKLNDAGIVTIKTPIDVTYRYFNRDLITPTTGSITDYFDTNDRTALFVLETLTTSNLSV
jgi:hypothetical protein